MENASQKKSRKWRERIAFALGNLGHSAFYGALSTYFIVFVTSGMFDGVEKSIANKLIGLITGLVVIIRLAEVLVDPVIGNVVDNTQTKWGKFKPWQVIGSVVSSILLVVIFTGIFGLAKTNWILFAILFVIIFITLDVFYSFCDVAYWGMVPAISEDSKERGVLTSFGSFTGSIGWNGLTIIVVPVTTFFTFLATGKHEQGPQGWHLRSSSQFLPFFPHWPLLPARLKRQTSCVKPPMKKRLSKTFSLESFIMTRCFGSVWHI